MPQVSLILTIRRFSRAWEARLCSHTHSDFRANLALLPQAAIPHLAHGGSKLTIISDLNWWWKPWLSCRRLKQDLEVFQSVFKLKDSEERLALQTRLNPSESSVSFIAETCTPNSKCCESWDLNSFFFAFPALGKCFPSVFPSVLYVVTSAAAPPQRPLHMISLPSKQA